jgi:hypothetical protein
MALEFTVCEVRWDRYPRVSENPQGREWLKFQSSRGLAANTLDAYGRNLDAYLGFLASKGIPFDGSSEARSDCTFVPSRIFRFRKS